VNEHWTVTGGYLYADATVLRFPANTALEGLRIPEIPRHQVSFQAHYANSSSLDFALEGRASSAQFDDDQNQFLLKGYFTLDAFASRRIAHGLRAFIAVENLFNHRYEVGKTPVTTLGPPILVRAGFRFHLGPG
jgi:outer membrane receptor protein involved in Fe transport